MIGLDFFYLCLPLSKLSSCVRDGSEPRSVSFQTVNSLCYTILHLPIKIEKCDEEDMLTDLNRIN